MEEDVQKSLQEFKQHSKYRHPMIGHFRAITQGSWDNMRWSKDAVGEHTKPFKDRHNFTSVRIRFKGEKTSRLVPEPIFKRFFQPTNESTTDFKQWKGSDKGGSKIVYGKRDTKGSMKGEDIKRELARKAKIKKKGITEMENNTDTNDLLNMIVEGSKNWLYGVTKNGNTYVLQKWMKGAENTKFRVSSSEDPKAISSLLQRKRELQKAHSSGGANDTSATEKKTEDDFKKKRDADLQKKLSAGKSDLSKYKKS